MATTYPKRYNFQTGTGSVSGTTITFDAAPSFSTLSTDEYIPITFVHATPASSEIVYLTAYTSGATTGTVVRAREGTSEGTWNAASTWEHAPTADLRIMNADVGASAAISPAKLATGLFPVGGHHIITPMAAVESASAGTWVTARDLGATLAGYYENWNAAAVNDSLSWKVYLEAGTYKLTVLYVTLGSNGIQTWKVDGSSIGTLDGYSEVAAYDVAGVISGWTVAASGVVTLQMILATKNASSSGYNCELGIIGIVRTA